MVNLLPPLSPPELAMLGRQTCALLSIFLNLFLLAVFSETEKAADAKIIGIICRSDHASSNEDVVTGFRSTRESGSCIGFVVHQH